MTAGTSPGRRRPARLTFLRLVTGFTGCAGMAILILGASGWLTATPTTAQAALLPGTASLTGTVESPVPFTAAQVFIRNVDKRILYTVFTNAGRFRSVALFPGTYEVNVSTKGLESDVQKISLKPGDSPRLSLSLRPHTIADTFEEASYDEIYPAGPGRDVAERTCIVCHSENFLPSRPGSASVWTSRIDRMMGRALTDKPAASYAEGLLNYRNQELQFSLKDREDLLAYLVKNFGPNARPRAVRVVQEMPLDQVKLGKAMYMEYYLTPDPPGQGINSPDYNKLPGGMFVGKRDGQDVRFDKDGNVWLTDRGYPHRLVKLDPRTGAQRDYVLPDPKNGIHEVNIDRTGMLWLPEHSGVQPSSVKRLLGFNPKTEKFEYQIPMDPDNVVKNPIKWLQSLAFDSKDNIYVGWIMGGALSKYDRETKKVSVFPLPTQNAIVYGVIADRNDNIWMALWDSGNIAKFDTHNNGWTIFAPPTYPGHVRRLNVDAQNNIWFGIYSAGKRPGKLAKLVQTTGRITEYTIPRQNTAPYDVSQDPDGNIWSVDIGGSAAALWKFNPRDETFTLYPKPQKASDTPKIQITRDGAIWYSPRGVDKFGAMDKDNVAAFGVLYPDMDKITTLAAYYVNGPPGYTYKPGSPAGRNSQ